MAWPRLPWRGAGFRTDMDTTGPRAVEQALQAALLRLLRPLVRLLLRHQVPFGVFSELAKHVYVQSALQDMALPGRKPTISRASVLTGLTRKDVQRLVAEAGPRPAEGDEGYNRAVRVLGAWARDAAFLGPDGRPAALALAEGEASFARLVRRYSGDMPVRAVLDELLRVGAVRLLEGERVELLQAAYLPREGVVQKLGILGQDVADLVDTIDHNLQTGAEAPRFQRKVMYRNFPAEQARVFQQLGAQQAQHLLEQMDRWLAEHGAKPGDPVGPGGRVRLGVGIYYFEEPQAPDPQEES